MIALTRFYILLWIFWFYSPLLLGNIFVEKFVRRSSLDDRQLQMLNIQDPDDEDNLSFQDSSREEYEMFIMEKIFPRIESRFCDIF